MTRPEFWQRWTTIIDGWLRRRRPVSGLPEESLEDCLFYGAVGAARTHQDCRLYRQPLNVVRSEKA